MSEGSPNTSFVRFKKDGQYRNFHEQHSRVDRTLDQLNTFCKQTHVTSDTQERLHHWAAALREPASKLALEPTEVAIARTFVNFMNSTGKTTDESFDLRDFFEAVNDVSS